MVKKGAEAKKLVKEYMLEQNRPFSAIAVTSNLKNEVGKAEAVRILDGLVEEGVLESKDYKKFRYYWANQSLFFLFLFSFSFSFSFFSFLLFPYSPLSSGNIEQKKEPAEIQQEIDDAEGELKQLTAKASTLSKKVSTLQSALSDEQIEERVAALEKENAELSDRLEQAKGSSETVTKESVEKIDKALKSQVTHWRKRKRCAMEMVNEISEGSGESVKRLFKTIELENDESNVVTLTEAIKATEPPPPPKRIRRKF